MNRRLAVAASVSASAVLVAGAVMVGALLSQGPEPIASPDLAGPAVETDSSSVTSVDPIVVYQDEYEYVVTGDAPAAGPAATDDGDGELAGVAPAPAASAAAGPAPVATVTAPTTTTAPKAATTTTTWPRGVPRDWPADKPIPPMPANCRDPQLEDNGVWNCQD